MLGWGIVPHPNPKNKNMNKINNETKYEKYDVKRIRATELAKLNEVKAQDILIRPIVSQGATKLIVEVNYGDDGDWQLVQRYWATNLPTEADLEYLKGKCVVDVMLQTGWNEDKEEWGKIKALSLLMEDGSWFVPQGAKDEPVETIDD